MGSRGLVYRTIPGDEEDAADRPARLRFRKPEIAVGSADDRLRNAVRRRDREFREGPGGSRGTRGVMKPGATGRLGEGKGHGDTGAQRASYNGGSQRAAHPLFPSQERRLLGKARSLAPFPPIA